MERLRQRWQGCSQKPRNRLEEAGRLLPYNLWREHGPADTWILVSCLQNCEGINFCCFTFPRLRSWVTAAPGDTQLLCALLTDRRQRPQGQLSWEGKAGWGLEACGVGGFLSSPLVPRPRGTSHPSAYRSYEQHPQSLSLGEDDLPFR